MYSRWFSSAVVVLWLIAMGWLVVAKVVPQWVVGEPPDRQTILAAQKREPPVGWTMEFGGRRIGWALCRTTTESDEVTEIRSDVHFDELPLDALAPPWLRSLLKVSGRPIPEVEMDVESTLSFDPLDRLERFESLLRLAPLQDPIVFRGTVEGTNLRLTVSGGLIEDEEATAYLPPKALVGDVLSPQTQLPGLRKGQTWTVPVYSPLRPFNAPLENLQATVERTTPITWDGQTVKTWLVVYHRESGFSFAQTKIPRGKLWVRRDGAVLRQQMMILDSAMTFERLSDRDAAELAERVEQRKNQPRE